MKKAISRIVVTILALAMMTSMPMLSFAADADYEDPGNVRAVYHASSDTIGFDVYNDDLFTGDAAVYDPQLALTTIALASTSCHTRRYGSDAEKYSMAPRNVLEFLEDRGFSDVEANEDYRVKPDGYRAPAVFAHKDIVENGRVYTLLALVPKGGAREAEFYRVAEASKKEGDTGDFAYFAELKDKTLQSAREYISKYGIYGNIKVWLPGYSRGGGVANLIAAEIIDDPAEALGSSVSVKHSDVYCYTFSSYKTAALTNDLTADRYRSIHHIIDNSDIVLRLPWETMSFGYYGQTHELREGVNKVDALRLLEKHSESDYESYIDGADPDSFYPVKLDIQALLKGKLSLIQDDESYLPYDQGEFIDSAMEPVKELFAGEGGNIRDNYYKNYQGPVGRMLTYVNQYDIPEASSIINIKTAVPFILSTYINFVVEKSTENGKVRAAELNEALERSFNALAYNIEDENGDLRDDVVKLKTTKAAYKMLRKLYFTENENAGVDTNAVPQKYRLKRGIKVDGNFTKAVSSLSAKLYAMTLKELQTSQGVDSTVISTMTSDEESTAMVSILTHFMFDNARQSSSIRPLDPDNEQFKQLATLIGNYKSCATLHYIESGMAWLESASGLYDDYEGVTDEQLAGYRRVYIRPSNPTDIIGTVRDADGNVVAEFVNDKMTEKTDKWVGYTKSDEGGWLRLPADKSYKVELTVTDDCDMSVKLAEYSAEEGKIVRTVDRDSKLDWNGLVSFAGDIITLDVPAAFGAEDECVLPSAAEYSMSVSKDDEGGETVKAVPKVKGLKLKAGKKSIKVSWKKLSAAQRANFSKMEVQYSTSKKFKSYKKIYVSKAKSSYKIKGLKKGRTYYVRARNIRKANNKTYVSKWSAIKKAKAK